MRSMPGETPDPERITDEDGRPLWWLFADGTRLPVMAGGDETPEEKAEREAAEAEQREREERERREAEDDENPETWDKERAARTIRQQRKAEREARERAEAAERERDELRRAQESEQERTIRERDEAKAEAERERARANRLLIDGAIRDAAGEAGVPIKRHQRVLRLIDREGISVDAEGNVDGADDAVEALLEELPELKGRTDDDGEPAGGNPDRKRNRGTMTTEQARKLAADDPATFNRLFDENKIPASAFGGG